MHLIKISTSLNNGTKKFILVFSVVTRKTTLVILFLSLLFISNSAQAQVESTNDFPTYNVGIFAPLYLDSIFTNNNVLRYKQGIPSFISPSLDFVHGVEIALDSMNIDNANINAAIYDSKGYKESVPWLIKNKKLDNLDLIIGCIKDAEYQQLADFALRKNIPFISATYPNDGGITKNPFLVIVNPTLKAHCEAIYSYILQNHSTDKIFLCRKKGSQEDKIANYLKAMNKPDGKPLLNIQTLNFDSTITSYYLKNKLDSNQHAVIIGGSLEEEFATNLTTACYGIYQQYPLTLIGMPNWDSFKSLGNKNSFKDFPIHFTSPYFNDKTDHHSKMIIDAFEKRYLGTPSDMAFKGFECAYQFTKILTTYSTDVMNNLNDNKFKVFSDYNFRPSMTNVNSTPDYLENKHLYFIKILNGATYKAW